VQEQIAMAEQVDLASLSVESLAQLKSSLEDEIEQYTRSFSTLRAASDRFFESRRCLEQLKGYKEGEKLLVPLTSSLFVEGEFGDLSTVLVDVGTGYFVSRSVPKAQDFMDRKMKVIRENVSMIQTAAQKKKKILEDVMTVLQHKLMTQKKAEGSDSS